MTQNNENSSKENLTKFVSKNKNCLIIVVIAAVCLVLGFTIGSSVGSKAKKSDLSKVDAISYTLTEGSASLEESELNVRRDAALADLASLVKKAGVVGVRANMLAAEVSYQKGEYQAAADYYTAAASKDKKAYTAPLSYFNAASCYEQLNQLDKAEENYKLAASTDDFVLVAHAKFSYGRILETEGKYAEAVAAYKDLNDKNPDDTWAKVAKTRIIALQAEGKAE